ncbi:hypothetical protein PR048_019515 [Dryococelus australis]|uniref:Uncharacterized protein n=1 Tax=Dryococelus australis TaxID=614101 RepID=A0ABQ9H3N9_9NEOP|nr:hypothetical protein PR048_019515 [Dryococelus australis]
MEQRRNVRARETGDPRENPPTNSIVRHDSHLRKSGVTRPGIEPGSLWWEASRLTAQPPRPRSPPSALTRRFRTLSSIQATNTSLTVIPQSPVVVHTLLGSRTLGQAASIQDCRPLGCGSIYSQSRPPEHSCVVAKRIGNSSRGEEVCDASKSCDCRYSRDSQKGSSQPRPHRSRKRRGLGGSPITALGSLVGTSCSTRPCSIAVTNGGTRYEERSQQSSRHGRSSSCRFSALCGTKFSCYCSGLTTRRNYTSRRLVVHYLRLVSPNPRRGRGVVVRLLASHLGEPGSIPSGFTTGFSYMGIEPDDAAGKWVFSETSFTLIGSQDFDVNSRPNLSTPLYPCARHSYMLARSPTPPPANSDQLSTQKTVAPFEFRAGLEIEMKFISNRRNWRFEIMIQDQHISSTNVVWKYVNR